MVHSVGVHAFDETQFVGDTACVRQKITHPGPALTVLAEGFYWREHEFAIGLARHGAEAFAADVGIGQRLSVAF